jgi:hypothetical protein
MEWLDGNTGSMLEVISTISQGRCGVGQSMGLLFVVSIIFIIIFIVLL